MIEGAAPPPRLSRAETRDNTRRALLEAAERCFFQLSYHGASLDAIAAEAGFTKGAVYWHFRNKEALFIELLSEGMKRNAADGEKLIAKLASDPGRLDDELGRWFDRFDSRNKVPLLALELDFESRHNPSFAALLDQVVARQQQVVGRLLDRYFEIVDRRPPMPIEQLATAIIAISKAVALARQTGHSANLSSAGIVRCLLGMPAPNIVPSRA